MARHVTNYYNYLLVIYYKGSSQFTPYIIKIGYDILADDAELDNILSVVKRFVYISIILWYLITEKVISNNVYSLLQLHAICKYTIHLTNVIVFH